MQKITEILSQKISENHQKIEDFFAKKFRENPPLFYNSVDLRHSEIKIAPVDTNCFPAGFNNLSDVSRQKAKSIADNFLSTYFPQAKKILILPESHTRNLRYLDNIFYLQEILSSKREVIVGTLSSEIIEKTVIDLENGHFVTLHPLQKNGDKIASKEGFEPDLIILNNDLTDGIPEILKNLSSPIIPSENLGWHSRTKSHHFDIYTQLAVELAQIIEIDPWLISSFHAVCQKVNFKEQTGLECLAAHVDKIISDLKEKYQQYEISDEPYCYIKADNGTYGIAVWPVFSGAEVLEINKKERNKMNMLKGSTQTSKVMIQEGIITADKINNNPCEPMIYMINGEVAQNLFRTNDSRDERISLNASGASFYNLENLPQKNNFANSENNFIIVYELIAKMAALSSSIELNFLKTS